jgi:alkylhydroperoxidase family enzyme
MRQGLDEARIRQLDLPEPEQSFSPRERLAIRFAEKMALDHRAIDDTFVAELRREFSDAEIVELGMMIGQYIGFGRLLVALGVDREASEPYLAGGG